MEILILMKQKARKLFINFLTILGLNKDNSMYYIGGAETLPAPLNVEEENELLLNLANGDDKVKKVLVERNLRLVVYIAKKFENPSSNLEDLISIGTIGLMKAINSFDVNKNIKLATYASRCIENEILMYLRKTSKLKSEVSIDEPLNTDGDGNELLLSDVLGNDEDNIFKDLENEIDRKLIKESIEKLNRREKKIMELRFRIFDRQGTNTKRSSWHASEYRSHTYLDSRKK